jgi:dihydroorotate dehydrogenase
MNCSRIPNSLNLAKWIRELIDSFKVELGPNVGDRVAISALAASLKVGSDKTILSWLQSICTEDGPSVHLNTDNFEALCDLGRWRGLNLELFCRGPVVWTPASCGDESRAPMPALIDVGKKFTSHGLRLAGEYLASPLILTAGVFSVEPEQIRWFLNTGVSGAETKSKLSHERPCRRSDQLLLLAEAPEFGTEYPRKRLRLLTAPYELTVPLYGFGVRVGAPSNAPPIWMARVDAAVSQARAGEVVILSIAAHVAGNPSREERLNDWRKVAVMASQTAARLVSINLACAALASSDGSDSDIDYWVEVCQTVAEIIRNKKLFLKVGFLPEDRLEQFLLAVGKYIHGVIAINCEIATACSLDQDNQKAPTWKESEAQMGIAGPALFPLNKLFLDEFVRIKARHSELCHLQIVSCGGVYEVDQISTLLAMGADAVGINSVLFWDSYFGLKARRYLDNNPARRRNRVNQEAQMIRDTWFDVYAQEVLPLAPASSEYGQRHRRAIQLLDRLLRESNQRITSVEQAASSSGRRQPLLSLSEMRERIRSDEDDHETN